MKQWHDATRVVPQGDDSPGKDRLKFAYRTILLRNAAGAQFLGWYGHEWNEYHISSNLKQRTDIELLKDEHVLSIQEMQGWVWRELRSTVESNFGPVQTTTYPAPERERTETAHPAKAGIHTSMPKRRKVAFTNRLWGALVSSLQAREVEESFLPEKP